ncbi:hypothetical protein RKD47_002199 [Streptomyces albogriseolus]
MPVSASTTTVTPSSPAEVICSVLAPTASRRFLAISLICLSVTWNGLLSSQLRSSSMPSWIWSDRVSTFLHDLPGHEPADESHHHEAEQRGQHGGRSARHPEPPQPGDGGLEQRGDEQRGDERQHHQLDGADDAHQHPDGAREHQQAPAGLGGDPDAPGHGLRRVGARREDDLGVFGGRRRPVGAGGAARGVVVRPLVARDFGAALLQPFADLRQSGSDPVEPSWQSRHDPSSSPVSPHQSPWRRRSDGTGRQPRTVGRCGAVAGVERAARRRDGPRT